MSIAKWFFRQFMRLQVYMYRRSGGKRMNRVRRMPILLLTTIGRKSGRERVTPVMFIRDGDNYVITASNNGAEENPGWFANLQADPKVKIEVDGVSKNVIARKASAEERSRLWPQLVRQAHFFEDYQKKAKRDIPMVILTPQNEVESVQNPTNARHV